MANCSRCGKVLTTLGTIHKTCKHKAEAEFVIAIVDNYVERHREAILRRVPDYTGPELKSGIVGEL